MGYQLCNQHDGLIDLNQNLEQLQKCLLSLRYSCKLSLEIILHL